MDDTGRALLELQGESACRELLEVLERPEPERAALIGRLYARGEALAEVLADVEADPDDLVRLRLIGALREVLGKCRRLPLGRLPTQGWASQGAEQSAPTTAPSGRSA